MRSLLPACLAVVLAACSSTSSPLAGQIRPPEPVTYTYHEVDGRALHAYVFAPAASSSNGEPVSAVLLFHGGGWSAGRPEWTFAAARRFAAHGMVAIPIQYRLSEGSVTPIEALSGKGVSNRKAKQEIRRRLQR